MIIFTQFLKNDVGSLHTFYCTILIPLNKCIEDDSYLNLQINKSSFRSQENHFYHWLVYDLYIGINASREELHGFDQVSSVLLQQCDDQLARLEKVVPLAMPAPHSCLVTQLAST